MKRSIVFAGIAMLAVACTGPRGYTGPQGATGMTGAQGPAGMTGAQGRSGTTASQAQPTPAGWVSLREIDFDLDQAVIPASEMSKISDIASYASENPNVLIGIDGSMDRIRGSNQRDVTLSSKRVANVREALLQTGISASRIETDSLAAERTLCEETPERCSRRDGLVEVLARSSN